MGKDLTRRVMAWGARVAGIVDSRMPDADLHAYLNHMAVLSPVVFLRMAEHMAAHSAGPWLPSIAAPTLVVAGERDVFTPLWCSEQIARELPRAKLFVLKGGSHAALVEQNREHSALQRLPSVPIGAGRLPGGPRQRPDARRRKGFDPEVHGLAREDGRERP